MLHPPLTLVSHSGLRCKLTPSRAYHSVLKPRTGRCSALLGDRSCHVLSKRCSEILRGGGQAGGGASLRGDQGGDEVTRRRSGAFSEPPSNRFMSPCQRRHLDVRRRLWRVNYGQTQTNEARAERKRRSPAHTHTHAQICVFSRRSRLSGEEKPEETMSEAAGGKCFWWTVCSGVL